MKSKIYNFEWRGVTLLVCACWLATGLWAQAPACLTNELVISATTCTGSGNN